MGTKNLQINSPELLADPSAKRAELGLQGIQRQTVSGKLTCMSRTFRGRPVQGRQDLNSHPSKMEGLGKHLCLSAETPGDCASE